jgi:hypothetical protein
MGPRSNGAATGVLRRSRHVSRRRDQDAGEGADAEVVHVVADPRGGAGRVGCASQAQFLDNKQGMAMQTVVTRGQFEMKLPGRDGDHPLPEVVQPVLHE